MEDTHRECSHCENTGLIRAWYTKRPTGEFIFKCNCINGKQSQYKIPFWSEKYREDYIALPSIRRKYGEKWQQKFYEWYKNEVG